MSAGDRWVWWRGFRAIVWKEVTQLVRDKPRMRLFVLLQVIEFVALAWIDTTIRNVPAVIVDRDHSAESREFLARVNMTGTFRVAYSTSSVEQAREHIRAGRARMAIVIPPDFRRARASGATADVLVLVDGTEAGASRQAIAAVEGAAARVNIESEQASADPVPGIIPHSVLMFNPQGSTASFLLPGLLAMLIANAYSARSMRSLVIEREMGNLERLLMTPMSYTSMIIGKLVPWFVLGVANGAIYLVAMRFLFRVPIRGSTSVLALAIALYVITCVALGSFIAAGAASFREATSNRNTLLFPGVMLSGYIFPLSSLPKVFLPIAYLMPQTHFIEVMRGTCLRGATLSDLAPNFIYLALAPLLLTIGAARRFSRSVID
jgi:ABC-2 type transport system permease protein